MCPPSKPQTEQEIYGRRGRTITDQDAHEINRVEELSYDLKIHEVMSTELRTRHPTCRSSDVLEILRINRISGVPVLKTMRPGRHYQPGRHCPRHV
jgi:hypothetical protein